MDEEKLKLLKEKITKSNKYILYVNYSDLLDLVKIIENQQKEIEGLKEMKPLQDLIDTNIIIADYSHNYISKDKIKSMINNFREVKNEILSNENMLGRASITYDIVRNDYCEKMLQELLEEE